MTKLEILRAINVLLNHAQTIRVVQVQGGATSFRADEAWQQYNKIHRKLYYDLEEEIRQEEKQANPNIDWTQGVSLSGVMRSSKADLESAKESLGGPAARHRIEQCQKDVDVILEKLQIAQVTDDKRERYKDRLLNAALALRDEGEQSLYQATMLLEMVDKWTERKFNGPN